MINCFYCNFPLAALDIERTDFRCANVRCSEYTKEPEHNFKISKSSKYFEYYFHLFEGGKRRVPHKMVYRYGNVYLDGLEMFKGWSFDFETNLTHQVHDLVKRSSSVAAFAW